MTDRDIYHVHAMYRDHLSRDLEILLNKEARDNYILDRIITLQGSGINNPQIYVITKLYPPLIFPPLPS